MKTLLTSPYVKGVLLFLITLLSLPYLYPVQSIQAAPCTTTFGSNNTITLEKGLLTLTDPAQAGQYTITSNDNCILGSLASIPERFKDYQEVLSTFYSRSKFSGQKRELIGNINHTHPGGTPQLNFNQNEGVMYHITGDLTLDSNSTIDFPGGKTGIVFVDGNLTILKNLTYGDNNVGVIFIVGGNINIPEGVTEVDAYMITFKTFCSGWILGNPCFQDADTESTLTIKGSVIALNSDTTYAPKFVRNTASPRTTPAELFQYQSKYLVIVRNIFSADRIIWTEIPY